MRALLLSSLLIVACSGPEASDAVLCRDVIQRLCAGPRCASVESQLGALPDCNATLSSRTHCDTEDFTFKVPTRNRWLECRAPLVKTSTLREAVPGCDNVEEVFLSCPDVVAFLKDGGS